jgi:hypothetical protein
MCAFSVVIFILSIIFTKEWALDKPHGPERDLGECGQPRISISCEFGDEFRVSFDPPKDPKYDKE